MDDSTNNPSNEEDLKEKHLLPLVCRRTNPDTGTPCFITFTQFDLLFKHHISVHSSSGSTPVCLVCGGDSLVCGHGSDLSQHYGVAHPNKAPMELRAIPAPTALRLLPTEPIPYGSSDKNLRPYACNTCGRSFAREAHLQRHEHSHTQEKPYECVQCGRKFARTDLLIRHIAKLHRETKRPSREDMAATEIHKEFQFDHSTILSPKPEGDSFNRCRFVGCPQRFDNRDDYEKHVRMIHENFDTSSLNETSWVDHFESQAVERPSRPSSRTSMSSHGSCGSGISHPPGTSKKKKKKVAVLNIPGLENWVQQSAQSASHSEWSRLNIEDGPLPPTPPTPPNLSLPHAFKDIITHGDGLIPPPEPYKAGRILRPSADMSED